MSLTGRDATSNLLSSAPETGRSSFASRKLPDAIECSRPSAAIELWGKQSLNFVLGTTKGHRRKAGWRFGSAARLRRKPGLQAALCYAIDLA